MYYLAYVMPVQDTYANEPPHDKPTKWHVRQAKTQISLGIRPFCWFCHEVAHITIIQKKIVLIAKRLCTPICCTRICCARSLPTN